VEQAAETIATAEVGNDFELRTFRSIGGCAEPESAVGSRPVVVVDVDAQHALEVTAVQD
jgi:hypothetical protein